MAIGVDRVQLTKVESTAMGGDDEDMGPGNAPMPIDPQEDAIEAAGIYLQDEAARDETVALFRDSGYARFADGNVLRFYDSAGTAYGTIERQGGSFIFGAAGTGAQGIYHTCKVGKYALGGTSTAEKFEVVDSGDGECFSVYADKTAKLYGNVTCYGHLLRQTDNAQDIGTSTQEWRNVYAKDFRATTGLGSVDYYSLDKKRIAAISATMNLYGDSGWVAKITADLSDDTYAKFIGANTTQRMHVRAYRGLGTVATYAELYHNGTDGYLRAETGHIRVQATNTMVLPRHTTEPPATTSGGTWLNRNTDRFRGRLDNDNELDFTMEWPQGTSAPASGMRDGDRWYSTEMKRWFSYDGSRSEWLSEETAMFSCGTDAEVATGEYLKGHDSLSLSSSLGFVAPQKGTVIGFSYSRGNTDSATWWITANGTMIESLATGSNLKGSDFTMDGDFNQNDVLAVRNATTGAAQQDVTAWVHVKWRP